MALTPTASIPELVLFFPRTARAATLTVIHEDTPDKYTVVENVPTQKSARTMTLDPKTHEVFTVAAQFGPRPAQRQKLRARARQFCQIHL